MQNNPSPAGEKRVIKFRARRKLNGDWVYGSYVHAGDDWCHIVPENADHEDIQNYWIRVITDTVGQFTGLKDLDGNEIYESDILKFDHHGYDQIGVIELIGNGFWIVDKKGDKHLPFTRQIIGNIHENKNLTHPSNPQQ